MSAGARGAAGGTAKGSKRGTRSTQKGTRREREFAALVGGTRVPLSGAAGGDYAGDVRALGLLWECKARADGFKQLHAWLDGRDALALKADRRPWLVVLPLDTLLALLDAARGGAGER